MAKKLSEVDKVSSMLPSQSFLIEAGGSERRISLEDVENQLAKSFLFPSAEYTLEKNSNPAFNVSQRWAVDQYLAKVGGYMLKTVGGKTYAAKLNSEDWNYFADGTKVDDAAKYETMVRFPKCYFKGEGKTMHFGGLNPVKGGHSFDSPEWIGAYLMYVDENGVGHSRPGVSPSHSRTMSQFWACAQKLSSDYGLAGYPFQCLINALYQADYGNLDSQITIGSGFQHSNWEACRNVPMGKCINLGDGSGKVLYTDSTIGDQYSVKLYGLEDLWGKLWEFRPNIRFYYSEGKRHAVIYAGNRVSNTATGRDIVIPVLNAGGSYSSSMLLGEYWDMIPTAISGQAATYYCDGYWDNTTGELLFVGACADYGSLCGLGCASSSDGFSYSVSSIGARLAFFSTVIEISGSELVAM